VITIAIGQILIAIEAIDMIPRRRLLRRSWCNSPVVHLLAERTVLAAIPTSTRRDDDPGVAVSAAVLSRWIQRCKNAAAVAQHRLRNSARDRLASIQTGA
jgi:hypothetical protein